MERLRLRIAADHEERLMERPKKRARSQPESPVQGQDVNHSEPRPETSDTIQHDPDYYFEDGSTVIRVENVLFKV
jgi:hypothetical protein